MKKPHIQIKDARTTKTVDGVKPANAYRVKLIAANGETLQTSEVLTSVKAVRVHLSAILKMFRPEDRIEPNAFTALKQYGVPVVYEGRWHEMSKSINQPKN